MKAIVKRVLKFGGWEKKNSFWFHKEFFLLLSNTLSNFIQRVLCKTRATCAIGTDFYIKMYYGSLVTHMQNFGVHLPAPGLL